jgi:hypothetical protein
MICKTCDEVMVDIWYGHPTWTKIELAKNDKLVLGGPVLKEYTHYCFTCQETYPLIEVPYYSYE